MKFNLSQRKAANQKLSPEAREFASSYEVVDFVSNLSQKYALDDEQNDLLDTEVYVTLLGLQTINDCGVSVEKITLNKDSAANILKDLIEGVFSKLETIIDQKITMAAGAQISSGPQFTSLSYDSDVMRTNTYTKVQSESVRSRLRSLGNHDSLAETAQNIANTNQ